MGKVYDLGTIPTKEIEKDISERIKDYTDVDIPVGLEVHDNRVKAFFRRCIDAPIRDDKIQEDDMLILTGEGYNDFLPKFNIPYKQSPDLYAYFNMKKVLEILKQNQIYYTGESVKSVSVVELPNILTMTIKY